MRTAELIVIGAGVLGTFHAYFAAQKGLNTLLIERNALPNDASTRNFGIIARSIVEADGEWAGYARDTNEIYRTLQQQLDITARATGSLYLASTDLERQVLREFDALAGQEYRCSYLDAEEALRRYPCLRQDYCAGALLFPDDLTLDPTNMLRQLIPHLARTATVQYLPRTTVVSVERSGAGCLVRDALGNAFAADRVIVCGGAEYRTLFPDRLARAGMRICKLQMLRTSLQPNFSLPHSLLSGLSIERYPAFRICPSYPLLHQQPRDEPIREYGIHLLLKQSPDGSVIVGDSHQYREVGEAGALEERTSALINEAILGYGRRMVALPTWEIASMWNGYYAVYPHGEIYTETIDEAIHIATGIGGKGMSTGPGFARQHLESLL